MSRLVDCWCAKSGEPCTRKATQEDMLCDQCRDGCHRFSIGVPGQSETMLRLVDAHARAEFT